MADKKRALTLIKQPPKPKHRRPNIQIVFISLLSKSQVLYKKRMKLAHKTRKFGDAGKYERQELIARRKPNQPRVSGDQQRIGGPVIPIPVCERSKQMFSLCYPGVQVTVREQSKLNCEGKPQKEKGWPPNRPDTPKGGIK